MKKLIYRGILPVAFALLSIAVSADAVVCDTTSFEEVNGVCVPLSSSIGLSDRPVVDIVRNFMLWLIGLAGFIAIVGFLISAVMYFSAAGDEERAKTAKKAFWYSVLGTVVALGGLVVITIIDSFLRAGTI